jgi:hypothetical protein
MWFGNLVTMRWFDDVWMKEVFANFMAAKIVNPSFPDINHELRFLLAHYPTAYDVPSGRIGWVPFSTEHEYGILDIAQDVENYKGSCMYATAEFFSRERQTVELRLGTPNAWKLWLNGEPLFARDEYHRNMTLDQYRVRAELQPGRNILLLKICQNEQSEDWAQRYQFQFRVTDVNGRAIHPARNAEHGAGD